MRLGGWPGIGVSRAPLADQRAESSRSSPRVYGWLGARNSRPARRHLHGPPCVHHHHLVGHLSDDAEVVRDQDDRRAELLLHAAEQPDDLRLHRHVEGRGRLVGESSSGLSASAIAIIARCSMPPENWCG